MTARGHDDAAVCAALARRHARTFAFASRFLPAEKRRGAFAVYAFCRVADDIVDEPASGDADAARRALEAHRAQLERALRGEPCPPAFRELAWAVCRFDVPRAPMHALLDTLRGDLAPAPFARWADLVRYCEGVASTVGTMCAHVFGLPAAPSARHVALRDARTLGVAMQLTNVLRDVGEDAARGRCYLPDEDLHAAGIARDEVLARAVDRRDPRWQALMAHEVARARALYAAAEPGLALVPRDARACALVCARGYAAILDALARGGYDSLRRRARAGRAARIRVAYRAWRESRRTPDEETRPVVALRRLGGSVRP